MITPKNKNTSVIILYRPDGRMLLEYRAKDRQRYPDCWGLFGGRIEEGESPREAIFRETKEELQYFLKDPFHLMTQELSQSLKYVFIELYDETQELILSPEESDGFAWYTYEEWEKLPSVIPHDGEVLKYVTEYISNNPLKVSGI